MYQPKIVNCSLLINSVDNIKRSGGEWGNQSTGEVNDFKVSPFLYNDMRNQRRTKKKRKIKVGVAGKERKDRSLAMIPRFLGNQT